MSSQPDTPSDPAAEVKRINNSEGRKLSKALRENPISHPLPFSLKEMDYEYETPRHVAEIYNTAYRAYSDKYPDFPRSICRLLPREHAKSEAGTVVFPTWILLKNPNLRVLVMSETEGQAIAKLREIRSYLEQLGPKYNRKIREGENNKTELTLERSSTYSEPSVKAAGFGSGVTGGHYDVIIFDDLVSWETQRTASRREKTWSKFRDYLKLGSKGKTVFLVLGTRKHPEDLYSHLIGGGAWNSKTLPAISDWSVVENKEYDLFVRHNSRDQKRRVPASKMGEIDTDNETIYAVRPHRQVPVLWPERWPLHELLLDLVRDFGKEEGSLVWKREMQNDENAFTGQILSESMLTFLEKGDIPRRQSSAAFDTGDPVFNFYAGLDPAVESDPQKAASNDTDFWSLSVVAHDYVSKRTYLADVERRRGMTMKTGLDWASNILGNFETAGKPISKLLVEDAQSQRWFVQQGKDMGLPVERSTSTGKKEDRVLTMSAQFESGNVKIAPSLSPAGEDSLDSQKNPTSSKWQTFVSEFVEFPSGAHDDMLDATEIALRAIEQKTVKKSRPSVTRPY